MIAAVQAIIVTHNSQQVLPRCLEAVKAQTSPVDSIVIVDSGSDDPTYLNEYEQDRVIRVVRTGNRGFSAANNLGMRHIDPRGEFVLFLNPDAFLDPHCVATALGTMRDDPGAGILSGKLFWFDVLAGRATDILDSTGVFRAWYGRWYDRGQGKSDRGAYDLPQNDIPAACGAMLFCRRKALDECRLARDVYFDPDFFLYKEDIELCLRARKTGWRVTYQPLCIGWHGRGWKPRRRKMPKEIRKIAARNEIMLYAKHPSPYMLWACVKYLLVRIFNI